MLVIKDDKGNDIFAISRDKELHFEVYRWIPAHVAERSSRFTKEGDSVPAKWVSTGRYPSTLAYAVQLVYDYCAMDEILKPERGLKASIARLTEIRDAIVTQVNEQTKVEETTNVKKQKRKRKT